MNYKLYISGYIEETQQLLVSFSSDDTKREAIDYQPMAFDVVPYGDISAEDVVKNIAKTAPSITNDMKIQEEYTNNDDKTEALRSLVGQTFNFTHQELYPTDPAKSRQYFTDKDAEEAEEI